MRNVNYLVKIIGVTFMAIAGSGALAQKIVVAHRGASGYLPEHTLEAKAMAYAMGAHYIEQDVVMTRDDQLIVLHDITLDRTTDVAARFPGRAREDGRHYVVDFTLDEIRSLQVREGVRNGTEQAIYQHRFPVGKSRFAVHTLAEEIELIQGLNRSTGKDIGLYPEVKSPTFHRQEGKDISTALVAMLKDYGYTSKQDKVFIQTFEFDELKSSMMKYFPLPVSLCDWCSWLVTTTFTIGCSMLRHGAVVTVCRWAWAGKRPDYFLSVSRRDG